MILRPCAACGQHVQRAALACPHCGAIRGGKLSRSAAAVVMGLTLIGADDPGAQAVGEPLYGVAVSPAPAPEPEPRLMPEPDYGAPMIPEPVDLDQDGVSVEAGDCDDTDPAVFPGAKERWFDGVDSDCDGKNNR